MFATTKIPTMGVAIVICIALALTGCVTLATDYRKIGFQEMQRSFEALPRIEGLHEVVELKNVVVHIVGDRNVFSWHRANQPGSHVAGYSTPQNEIWVFGAVVNGRIVINQAVLGHEMNHLLHFATAHRKLPVHNPDYLDDIGA